MKINCQDKKELLLLTTNLDISLSTTYSLVRLKPTSHIGGNLIKSILSPTSHKGSKIYP